MELNYDQAMNQLQAMFGDLEVNTIRNVLAANRGDVEPTIDELLRLQSANEGNNEDNMFANSSNQYPGFKESMYTKPGKSYGFDNNNNGFGNSNSYGNNNNRGGERQLSAQEQKDIELAYQLQKKFMEEDKAVEEAMKRRPQTAQQQPGQNNNFVQSNSSEEKKKKKGFMAKISGGIKNIFDKKGKGKGPTKHTGTYSNIEHLGDDDDNNGFGFHATDNMNNNYNNYNNRPINGIGHNQQPVEDDDQPMQLDDILGPSGHDNNNFAPRGNSAYGNNRNNSGAVNRDHFGY